MTGTNDESPPKGGSEDLNATGWWLLVAYAVSGAAALVYEVAWMRELGSTLGATAYAPATMLTAFMMGLGIGSLLGGWLAKLSKSPLRNAARAELAIAGFSAIALLGIVYLPGWLYDALSRSRVSAGMFFALQFIVSFAVMLLPTVAMGLTFPLVMESASRTGAAGRWASRLCTSNTLGAILGSLAAGFVLIPAFGSKGALVFAAVLSATAAWVFAQMATITERAPAFWTTPEPFAAIAALALLVALPAPPPAPISLTLLGRHPSTAALKQSVRDVSVVFDKESVYSRVTVLKYPDGTVSLRNGALIEGSNSVTDKRTTAVLAGIALMSASATDTALVIGLGTGSTSGSLLSLNVGHVTTVEINPAISGASKQFVGDLLSSSPQWSLVLDDARSRILTSKETYDVITSEPSWPLSASVAPLFTREFMRAAKSRLKPGGAFSQWLPDYMLGPEDVKMMYKTARQVFPRVDVWTVNYSDGTPGELVLVGFNEPAAPSQAEIGKRISAAMKAFGYENAFSAHADPAGLERAVDDPSIPLNTDDHALLEYRVVWNFLASHNAKLPER